jgi:hypothetical protein
VADFLLSLVDNTIEVVDGGLRLCKLLLADGHLSIDHGDEPKGDGIGGAVDVIVVVFHLQIE